MTPAEFNSLPLEQQLKQLQPGDELHLRGGGWLPFVAYDRNSGWPVETHHVALSWDNLGILDAIGKQSSLDITRVIRPTPKEQP